MLPGSALQALAQWLNLRGVSAGVETEVQARFLTEIGREELQGYLLSCPFPPTGFEAYLRI
jgi:EAL domain-containing protein (putative c-di-GMP-specific phosphodiesterase class I)